VRSKPTERTAASYPFGRSMSGGTEVAAGSSPVVRARDRTGRFWAVDQLAGTHHCHRLRIQTAEQKSREFHDSIFRCAGAGRVARLRQGLTSESAFAHWPIDQWTDSINLTILRKRKRFAVARPPPSLTAPCREEPGNPVVGPALSIWERAHKESRNHGSMRPITALHPDLKADHPAGLTPDDSARPIASEIASSNCAVAAGFLRNATQFSSIACFRRFSSVDPVKNIVG
jgi:hypothetical protein